MASLVPCFAMVRVVHIPPRLLHLWSLLMNVLILFLSAVVWHVIVLSALLGPRTVLAVAQRITPSSDPGELDLLP
jgi:hypothetical protein